MAPPSDSSDKLFGWKSIAEHFHSNVRTAQRWERRLGLPVHRLSAIKGYTVYAFRQELDDWLKRNPITSGTRVAAGVNEGREQQAPVEPQVQGVPENPVPRHRRLWLIATVGVTACGLIIILTLNRRDAARLTAPSIAPTAAKKIFISSVRIMGGPRRYQLTVSGVGFGNPLIKLPFRADTPWLALTDVTCSGNMPGRCEAGYTGDADPLIINRWSNRTIVVSDYTVANLGDALLLGIWNPYAVAPYNAATWAGSVPGGSRNPSPPVINAIAMQGTGSDLHIEIHGRGFGPAPNGIPGVTDTAYLRFADYSWHSWTGKGSVWFTAGYQKLGVRDSITMDYQYWSNREIRLAGFGGAYRDKNMPVRAGDPYTLDVWSTRTHRVTSWAGRIP